MGITYSRGGHHLFHLPITKTNGNPHQRLQKSWIIVSVLSIFCLNFNSLWSQWSEEAYFISVREAQLEDSRPAMRENDSLQDACGHIEHPDLHYIAQISAELCQARAMLDTTWLSWNSRGYCCLGNSNGLTQDGIIVPMHLPSGQWAHSKMWSKIKFCMCVGEVKNGIEGDWAERPCDMALN